jgi:hypothetical protein
MCNLHLLIVYQPLAHLTYGCQKEHTMCLLLSIVNFISSDWETKHINIGLFEVTNTSDAIMILKLQELLNRCSMIEKNVAYIKDERFNL